MSRAVSYHEMRDALDAACRDFANSGGLGDEGEQFSLADLSVLADGIADSLRAEGAEADEPVGVLVSNRARDFAAFLGAWRADCVVAPVHRGTPPLVLANPLERLGARFVIDCLPASTAPALKNYGLRGRKRGHVYVLDRPAPAQRPLLEGAALIIYTSGTTGQPKGAVLSHRAFAGKLATIDSLLRFGPHTRTLLVLQITFSFGIWVGLLTLIKGGRLAVQERFSPERLLPGLLDHRASAVALVPTMLRAYLGASPEKAPPGELQRFNALGCLGHLLTGGEPLGKPLAERAQGLFPGAALVDIYGLTETCTSDFFLMPADQAQHLGCIGRPSPGVEFRIADEEGHPAAPGAPGELQIRTPYIMSGYLDDPDITKAAFHEEYFRTGDLAREVAPGLVELVGRAKEMISRGAAKISPLEIEQTFAGHPAVAEALVTGVPDSLLGERIHIMIVLRRGQAAREEELREWAASRLERYKLPDRYHFGSELPLGRTGKADRAQLRELLSGGKPQMHADERELM
ncbi:MAG: class I adenylate-forming enzyme family protein [SAR324 cluster bacterium]|nr:class I adenylate-forming enzyme family protein [SAR324 cluster bacterium]